MPSSKDELSPMPSQLLVLLGGGWLCHGSPAYPDGWPDWGPAGEPGCWPGGGTGGGGPRPRYCEPASGNPELPALEVMLGLHPTRGAGWRGPGLVVTGEGARDAQTCTAAVPGWLRPVQASPRGAAHRSLAAPRGRHSAA